MNHSIPKTKYQLMSVATGNIFNDTGWILDAPGETEPVLVRAVYEKKQLELNDEAFGIYKLADWLPVHKMLQGSYAPITYKSKGLARKLGFQTSILLLVAIGPSVVSK